MSQFVAHLHPVLVHLPIGILLVAALVDWWSIRPAAANLAPAVPWLLRFGAVAALAACGSGWLLAQSGDYPQEAVFNHQWLGFATAAAATTATFAPYRRVFSTLSALLLVAAGHEGGKLTHGEDYLTFQTMEKGPVQIQQALVYEQVVAQILQEKCTSCHQRGKQKGGLRLDTPEGILKGGKSGAAIVPGQIAAGELLRRCLLPLGHEEHMPPKEKPQLNSTEVDILQWWIAAGAPLDQRVETLPQTPAIQRTLEKWSKQSQAHFNTEAEVFPVGHVKPADPALIAKLNANGITALPVSQSHPWLTLRFDQQPSPSDSIFNLLEKLTPQLLAVNLSGCTLPPSAWPVLGKMTHVVKLQLDHSNADDAAMDWIKGMPALRSLSLTHTHVSAKGVGLLADCKSLKKLYLHGSRVTSADWPMMGRLLPSVDIDTGGYLLPFLETDTARLAAPKDY